MRIFVKLFRVLTQINTIYRYFVHRARSTNNSKTTRYRIYDLLNETNSLTVTNFAHPDQSNPSEPQRHTTELCQLCSSRAQEAVCNKNNQTLIEAFHFSGFFAVKKCAHDYCNLLLGKSKFQHALQLSLQRDTATVVKTRFTQTFT